MAIVISIFLVKTPVSVAFEILMYNEYKSSIKEGKSIKSKIAFLRQQIEKEKDHLKRLK